MNMLRISALSFIVMLAACGDTGSKKCPLGAPSAIFSPEVPGIEKHHFEAKDQDGLEEALLERGVYLRIYQSGCDQLRQEFQFQVPGNYANFPDTMWMKEAVRQFYHLGNLSEQSAGLKMWASAIEGVRSDMRLGEPKQLDQNIFVQIDKIAGAEESTLRVVLLQK
jgi:hypothetical protein